MTTYDNLAVTRQANNQAVDMEGNQAINQAKNLVYRQTTKQ